MSNFDSKQINDIGQRPFPLGTYARYCFNFDDNKYHQIEDNIELITDIPVDIFLKRPITENLIQILDMAQSEIISQCILQTIEKFKKKEIKKDDTVCLIYSIKTSAGKRKRIMDQFQISYLENGTRICTQGIITDISHLGTEGLPTFQIIRNGKVILKYSPTAEQIIRESKLPLSKTEFQLLQMIARGVFSKDIAEALNISINTFYTHRRNIRDKMNMEINSVIALLRQKGYL